MTRTAACRPRSGTFSCTYQSPTSTVGLDCWSGTQPKVRPCAQRLRGAFCTGWTLHELVASNPCRTLTLLCSMMPRA
eukprot:5093245-Prymnesium_polylepis.1